MSIELAKHFKVEAIPETVPPQKPQGSEPKAELWFELKQKADAADTELIRHRFLCRGGGLLFVGQTGSGKSSFSRQMALYWAAGQSFAGLEPVRPLRILIVQAENDDADEAEMCEGVVMGCGLGDAVVAAAGDSIFHYREVVQTAAGFFAKTLKPLLEKVKPDILIIDPLLAYLGGDQSSQEVVGGWLRNQLNPLLMEYNCAAVLVHHTPKITLQKVKEGWFGGDFSYFGVGSAEFANWSRAILCLVPTKFFGTYILQAAKRGGRLRWKQKETDKVTVRRIVEYSRKDGEICWNEVEGDPAILDEKTGKPIPTPEEFLSLFPRLEEGKPPAACLLTAGEIRNAFSKHGWKRDSYAGECDRAVKEGQVKLVQEGRGNRKKLFGRPEAVDAYLVTRGASPETQAA